MRLRPSSLAAVTTVAILWAISGCSSSEGAGAGSGGAATTGGSSSGGSSGHGTGGLTSSGGVTSTGGTTGSGGLASSGGLANSGGLASSGGLTSSGGASSGGSSSGGSGGASAIPATFETLKFVIANVPCFGAGCHNDAQNPLNMKVDDQLYTRLTARISTNCGNIPVVNPGKPQESAIVKILKGPCGTTPRMPVGCVSDGDSACVPSDYIAAITQWIANGAPKQ